MTANQRLSFISAGRPFAPTLPLPDGTLDAGNRAHLLYLYASSVGAPVVAGAISAITVTSAGTITITGSGSATLGTVTVVSVGEVAISGTGGGTLDAIVSAGNDQSTDILAAIDRTFIVPAESRTFTVSAAQRGFIVPHEERIFEL